MKTVYIGDIMADPGLEAVRVELPKIRATIKPDLIIAQAENVSDGKSMTVAAMKQLQTYGIDFFTGGNHTPKRPELHPLLANPQSPVIGPANMPSCPGPGWKYIDTKRGRVLIVTLLGNTVGKEVIITNPLQKIDAILAEQAHEEKVATFINFHGDYSSQKRIIGYYLDGKVTAVIGDHWHVPTADAMILPNGTAHMTDVGMCGSLHSSLGVKLESVIPRWRDDMQTLNVMSNEKPYQFNAVLVESDDTTGLATAISPLQSLIV